MTFEVLRREVGDWSRFNNRRQVSSYTGLRPPELHVPNQTIPTGPIFLPFFQEFRRLAHNRLGMHPPSAWMFSSDASASLKVSNSPTRSMSRTHMTPRAAIP